MGLTGDNQRYSRGDINITGVQKGERDKGTENFFEEIMANRKVSFLYIIRKRTFLKIQFKIAPKSIKYLTIN